MRVFALVTLKLTSFKKKKDFNKKVWGENWIYKRRKKEKKCQHVSERDVEKGERGEKKKQQMKSFKFMSVELK